MKLNLKLSLSWYFGWNVVAVASVLTFLTVGIRVGVGPLFFPIMEDLGLNRTSLSLIIALSMLIYGLTMPVAGWLVTRYSTRRTLLFGSLLIMIGGLTATQTHDQITFTVTFGGILSIGLGLVSPVSMTPLLSRWFDRRRSMALLYLSTGSMAGLALITPIFAWSSHYIGWRDTLFVFFLAYAVMALPSIYFIMIDYKKPSLYHNELSKKLAVQNIEFIGRQCANDKYFLTIRGALCTSSFWIITLGLFANGFSMTLLGVHGVPMLIDHGINAQSSALGIGLIGISAIFSTVIIGRIADHIPQNYLLSSIYGVRGLAFVALLLASSEAELYVVAIISGLVWAGAMAVASTILGTMYGVKSLGILYGIAFLFQQLAGMLSAWLGGWGFVSFQTHWFSFGFAAAILILSALLTVRIKQY